MSGHSHFKTIKRAKGLADAKRGNIFSKMSQMIAIVAREGGGDPNFNSKLRMTIEKAKTVNMPTNNIERAVKRGIGGEGETVLQEIVLEALGPGGIAIIIEGITDNKNRTLGETKQILNQFGGKLADSGSVQWLFEKKGVITVNPAIQSENLQNKENLELVAIESGAQDLYWHIEGLDIYTKPGELEKVRKNLEEKGIKTDSISLDWVAKEEIPVDEKIKADCQKLFEALDENDSVQEIYSNLKV